MFTNLRFAVLLTLSLTFSFAQDLPNSIRQAEAAAEATKESQNERQAVRATQHHGELRLRYATRPLKPIIGGENAAEETSGFQSHATVASVPLWSATSGTYTYTMVGNNPMVVQTSQTTTISVPIIPVIIRFADGNTFDPTVASACSAQTPLSLTLSSPVFSTTTYTPGGTSVGATQYADFYQRSNFWKFTGPTGINPNFHFLLSGSSVTPITITVPAASGSTSAASCGRLGQMDINWYDTYLQTTIFPQLAKSGILPSQFPIFLFYNVVMADAGGVGCCYLGYHSAFNNPSYSNAIQTYASATFLTAGGFGTTADVESLSHEVVEWLSDPTGNNPTPPWRRSVGAACETKLEPGDPLSGTSQTITMSNAYTYHVQELAFQSWFYKDVPSVAVNGWYSSNKTFTAPSPGCNASTTALTITPTTVAVGSASVVSIKVAGTTVPTGSVTLTTSLGATIGTYPLTNGAYSGSIAFPAGTYTVTANYPGDSNFATSASSGVAMTVGSALVSLNPVALTFAGTTVGTAASAQIVTLTNSGTAPLTSVAISLAGASPGDFSQTNTCAATLAAKAACAVTVTFKPTASGIRSATLSIADNVIGSPQLVPLTGTGIAVAGTAKSILSSSALTFAATNVGATTAAQSINLTNSGTAALTGIALAVTGTNLADFPITTTCTVSLAAGASCNIGLAFKPSAAGTRTATVTLLTILSPTIQTITLTGTGVTAAPRLTLSDTALVFATTTVKASSPAKAITLTNSGTAALSITKIAVTGSNPVDFTQTNTCGTSLAPNSTCAVTVTFIPTAKGTRSASLTITGALSGAVALTGTGK